MSTHQLHSRRLGDWEFIILTASMMSLVALSIDIMLPALPLIGADLNIAHANDRQMIISTFMAGLTLCQIIYGPWSDKVGRKPAVLAGTLIFLTGSVVCILSQNLDFMLAGRFLQGCGLAAMRILSMTIVRDMHEGRAMARIMSMVMALFILVPCLAPMVGQATLLVSHWRTIFVILGLAGLLVLIWFLARQQETLLPENRRPFNPASLWRGFLETCSYRESLGYTLASGLASGAFVSYLLTSQQIFQDVFQAGEKFVLYFALLALGYGIASLFNSRLVVQFGMRRISYIAIGSLIVFSSILLGYGLMESSPSLMVFMCLMMVVFFSFSFLFGNMNAIAMQPLGHLAGTASSVISLISGVISLIIGAGIGQVFNGTIIPFATGAVGCSIATLLVMRWADADKPKTGSEPLDKAA